MYIISMRFSRLVSYITASRSLAVGRVDAHAAARTGDRLRVPQRVRESRPVEDSKTHSRF